MPHVIAHCWKATNRPRLVGGAISEMYTGTWADSMPTQNPLIRRPTILKSKSMKVFQHVQIKELVIQHGNVLRGADDCGTNTPEDAADHDGLLSAEDIGEVPRDKSTNPRAARHRCRDTTLCACIGTTAFALCDSILVEVTFIRLGANDGTHGRDVETEQTAANDLQPSLVSGS